MLPKERRNARPPSQQLLQVNDELGHPGRLESIRSRVNPLEVEGVVAPRQLSRRRGGDEAGGEEWQSRHAGQEPRGTRDLLLWEEEWRTRELSRHPILQHKDTRLFQRAHFSSAGRSASCPCWHTLYWA